MTSDQQEFSFLKYFYYEYLQLISDEGENIINYQQEILDSLIDSVGYSEMPEFYGLLGDIYGNGLSSIALLPNK